MLLQSPNYIHQGQSSSGCLRSLDTNRSVFARYYPHRCPHQLCNLDPLLTSLRRLIFSPYSRLRDADFWKSVRQAWPLPCQSCHHLYRRFKQ
jgi:hypothetical protein